MAENKMSVSGLVNPENAKKLGMFSGVDAMLFGTITPVGTNINVTVKIITTETAEIVGGAKAQFKSDDTVQQFLSQPTKAEDAPDAPKTTPPPAALATQQFSKGTRKSREDPPQARRRQGVDLSQFAEHFRQRVRQFHFRQSYALA